MTVSKTYRFNLMNYIIFLINSICSLIILFACIVSITQPFFRDGGAINIFAIIGGVILLPIPVIVLRLEWAGTIRKKYKHLRTLGKISLGLAVFVLFGYIANVYETIHNWDDKSKQFIIWFSLICGILVIYNTFSGIIRIRLKGKLNEPL